MAESPLELAVGAVTIAVAAGFVAYAVGVAGVLERGGPSYTLAASFDSAQGVGAGSEIRLAGVRIGAVEGMSLNVETYRAEMRLAIRGDVTVPEDSSAVIATDGLLGGTYVEITPGSSPFALAEGEEIVKTRGAQNLLGLLSQVVTAARN